MTQQFQRRAWAFAVLACLALLVLAVLPPFVGPGLRHAIVAGFDPTCHQIPERSFMIEGVPFALCHRCTGVVIGLVAGSLILGALRGAEGFLGQYLRTALILFAFPMIADWGLDALGMWSNAPWSRVSTGIVFGIAAGYAFARAVALRPSVHLSAHTTTSASPTFHPTHPAHAQ